MTRVSVRLNSSCIDILNLAGRLDGSCINQEPSKNGFKQVFEFPLESRAEKFADSVRYFPEVLSVGRSLIDEAIANSRLCACGFKTVLDCNSECDRHD